MFLQSSQAVTVFRPVAGGFDRLGNPAAAGWEAEEVAGVLIAPAASQDLGAERPEGYTDALTIHFPKEYTQSLLGCEIELPAPWPSRVRVIGDPQPYQAELTPGRWNRAADCEVSDG